MGVMILSEDTFDYLKLQYEEGARIIRFWIECRYKILQFVGYFNAAVLTLGFGQKILLSESNVAAGLAICVLSFLVAMMGLATELSTTSYNYGYFEYLRIIEDKMSNEDPSGIITHSRNTISDNAFHKILPVHRAHKFFYVVLAVFWIILFVYQAQL
jgi:hypothetical protein